MAAQSAGIIPGSPLPVLDTEGLSGVSPLSPDAVNAVVTGQDVAVAHQNGGSVVTVAVSFSSEALNGLILFVICKQPVIIINNDILYHFSTKSHLQSSLPSSLSEKWGL